MTLQERVFHAVAIPQSGLIKAYGEAEAKEKAWQGLQACYGNDFNILGILDITERKISNFTYEKNRLF